MVTHTADSTGPAGLEALGSVRRGTSSSSISGQPEFRFWHAVTRDVAYQHLTRECRAEKHERLAHWLERLATRRRDAAMPALAHHYAVAYELRNALRDTVRAAELGRLALPCLMKAGDQSMALDVSSAVDYFQRAHDIVADDDALGPQIALRLGEALSQMGQLDKAKRLLGQAIDGFRARGQNRNVALAMSRLSNLAWICGDRASDTISAAALELLDGDDTCPELVPVLESWTAVNARRFDSAGVIQMADRAIGVSAELGLTPPLRAMHYRALSRCDLGEAEGLAELRETLDLARERGAADIGPISQNLIDVILLYEGPQEAIRACSQWKAYAAQRGDATTELGHRSKLLLCLFHAGEWERACAEAPDVDAKLESKGLLLDLEDHRSMWAQLLTLRGDVERAAPLALWAKERGRTSSGNSIDALIALAEVSLARGDPRAGARLLDLFQSNTPRPLAAAYAPLVPQAVRLAVTADEPGIAERLCARLSATRPFDLCAAASGRALLSETAGDVRQAEREYRRAAKCWSRRGEPWERAQALFGLGRCLVTLGRESEADAALAEAREIFQRLGARPALQRTDAWMARSPHECRCD